MPKDYLIKVYYSFDKGKQFVKDFFEDLGKTLEDRKFILGLNFYRGKFFFSYTSDPSTYSVFESQFYTYFSNFQIITDVDKLWDFHPDKTVVGEFKLENNWFYPFKYSTTDSTEFIFNIFRVFENFDVIHDKVWFFVEVKPLRWESSTFFIKSKFQYFLFKILLVFRFFKFMFNFKIQKNWKKLWHEYFTHKLEQELFETKVYLVCQSKNKEMAEWKVRAFFNNFLVFKNYPLNQFKLKIHNNINDMRAFKLSKSFTKYTMSHEELSSFFHFPQNPKSETSLLKVTARKLALPIGIPTYDYEEINGEILARWYSNRENVVGISDYRSIRVPVGIYDEDRLRHMYIIGKTWVGKSKFITSMIIDDLKQWKWIWLIDPHGDLIEEVMMHIPPERRDDVIIFDPTDEQFPFCLNPLDVEENESKQILAKWFIDIFKKFFWANWNPKLEHVIRMIFLALLDKPNSTLFDIIRALTDKDFRYEMIECIWDDVVRNFWTNEFAGWSQQFNTEAIMPILNKVGQLLSIDILKNIFASPENKLDFRKVMDDKKILLIKLPKWKLQEEIMWFLGAMFVTKIFQTAMGRQSLSKSKRTPFFLYVDEFQNFATETFNEILSEARKYWLWLVVAHQFIKQIPGNISDALFGNVWTIVSFRISSEDAIYMKQHFDPFLDAYDLANLNQREFYCKLLVEWQVKDPFSVRTRYTPDVEVDRDFVKKLYELTRKKYSRSLEEAKRVVETSQKDVVEKIGDFWEPII